MRQFAEVQGKILHKKYPDDNALRQNLAMIVTGFFLWFGADCCRGQVYQERTNALPPFIDAQVGAKSAPAFVDFDRDGYADAFVGADDGSIHYFKSGGSYGFAEQMGAANPFNGVDVGTAAAPAFLDFNGDGLQDGFIGAGDGTIRYFKGDGSYGFIEQIGAANPFNGVDVGTAAAPAFLDFDGDGRPDAFIGAGNGAIRDFKGNGSYGFTEQTGAANPFNGVDVGSAAAPAFLDYDGDGRPDAFIGTEDGAIRYFKRNGSYGFAEQMGAANPFNGVDVGAFAHPAFSGGDAFVGEDAGTIRFFKKSSYGFDEQSSLGNPFSGAGFGSYATPAMVDIDGDGDLDAFVGTGEGVLRHFRNIDGGHLVEQTGYANPLNNVNVGSFSAPSFADVDGDGDSDAAIGSGNGTIRFFTGNGSYGFTEWTGAANPFNGVDFGAMAAPAFLDYDRDGIPDCFIGADNGAIRCFKGNGSYGFVEQFGSANPMNGISVKSNAAPTFAQIEGGDSHQEAFIGAANGTTRFFKRGSYGFVECAGASNPLAGVQTTGRAAPCVADFDNDGLNDVFIGDRSGKIRYFQNVSESSFIQAGGKTMRLAYDPVLNQSSFETSFQVQPNSRYALDATDNLASNIWYPIGDFVADSAGVLNLKEVVAGKIISRFYRISPIE